MPEQNDKLEADRRMLIEAQRKGGFATLGAFLKLSGPGWLQSAITLGGGSLSASLYLGVLAGFSFLWLQPFAMILGIIMLSAIAYVTTSTGERPFGAINKHVSPVLGWAWLLAALSANMFWCLPQYALANGVLQANLMPDVLGPNGMFGEHGKLAAVLGILFLTTAITWAYDGGGWGVKLYELILKLMVAGVVLCFIGVLFAIRNEIDWGSLWGGFIPDLSQLSEPAPAFAELLGATDNVAYWTDEIVGQQQANMIGAAATAVGINMTFLFPYSILAKKWGKEFRGLAVFDLATGMFIPFVLATSCVVIAAADRFHGEPTPGFFGEMDAKTGKAIEPSDKARGDYEALLGKLAEKNGLLAKGELNQLKNAAKKEDAAATARLATTYASLPEADRRLAAVLIKRDVFDLAKALSPLAGDRIANLVFGLGVLGMALSTITLLMLISGFCVCEALNVPSTGWPHRFGTLAAATGALGPFFWTAAEPALAVYVSAFGLMLLPIAYWTFFFMMNSRKLLGEATPRGTSRLVWNTLMFVAAGVATAASVWSVYGKLGVVGLAVMGGLVVVGLGVHLVRGKNH